ncbi:MAG: hypothetical protein ACI4Q7_02370 [Candidatus Avelusimicrobium sp.]
MTFNYKRKFEIKQSVVPSCQFCGEHTVCALPVFLRVSDKEAVVVCHKSYCLSCGKIQAFVETDATGNQKRTYAFWLNWGRKCRDFFLPREMYETSDGKADVGLKVRLVRALLALQVKTPSAREFTKEQVYEELYRQQQSR